MARAVATSFYLFGNARRIVDSVDRYLRVTAEDVRRVAAEYLVPDNTALLLVRPEVTPKAAAKASARSGEAGR
jgi:predicted Zn-dependent peptidase